MRFHLRTVFTLCAVSGISVCLMFVMYWNRPFHYHTVPYDELNNGIEAKRSADKLDIGMNNKEELAALIKRVVHNEIRDELKQHEELLKDIHSLKLKQANQAVQPQQHLLIQHQQQQQQLKLEQQYQHHHQQQQQQQSDQRKQQQNLLLQQQHQQEQQQQQHIKEQELKQKQLHGTLTMRELHEQTYNKLSKGEIIEYYRAERISNERFNKVLDLGNDRDVLQTLFPDPIEHRDRVTDQLRVKLKVSEMKTIYVKGHSGNNQKKFLEDNCNVKMCKFTKDPKVAETADAIYSETAIPNGYGQNHKNPNQVLITFQIESAANAQWIGKRINWTANYRRDSVINAPYERFTPFLNITDLPNKPLRNFAAGKTKMAAWFVSNCGAVNRRDTVVKELSKYISVDIYGRCGKFHCIKSDHSCFKKLQTDYKFYLAFENSNCKDYVTEKLFWNGFLNDIIPIVMGAHRNEYKRIAPPNSYIHVDDFESPKQLAEYLKFLDQNDDAYNEYFLWKDTGRFINTKFMCRMCTMVHLAPYFPMWYSDGNKWWKEDICVDATRNSNNLMYSTWRGRSEPRQYVKYVRYGYERDVRLLN